MQLFHLTGYFMIKSEDGLTKDIKDFLIERNAIAILMAYLRSEESLLTAQSGVECVVWSVFNINKMLENER